MDKLIGAIRAIYADGIEQQHESAEHLDTLCSAIDQLDGEQSVASQSFPVVDRYLRGALAIASDRYANALARALEPISHRLSWQQPDYGDAPEFQILKTNYAYALIAGPEQWGLSNFHCADVFFGVSLQAPHTLYAGHAHKAPEIYYVVSGNSQWKRGDEDWQDRSSGSLIFHDQHVGHAMQSFDEPLLSLFAWTSDLDSEIAGVNTHD